MVQAANNGGSTAIAGRGGSSSPIGTANQNSGSTASTNSSYGPANFTSGITELDPTTTSYKINNTDYQGVVLFNSASAIAVTLNGAVQDNFSCDILNLNTGIITLTPDSGYLVNGGASLALGAGQGCTVYFANRTWVAFVGTTVFPSFAQISGTLSLSQLPAAGLSVTITTAKLTVGGANGSMTFSHGLLTAQTPAT